MTADPVNESLVAQIPIFSALPRSEIAHLAGHLRHVDIPAGSLLLREGEPGDRMFILVEGRVEILKALGTDDERVIAVRAAGDFFGETSLLETAGKRTASTRTLTPVKLWELSRADFETLLHRRPAMAYAMLREISERLRAAQDGRIAVGDVAGKGMAAAIIMALTRSLLRAEAGSLATPVETLRRANRLLRDFNDSPAFVTLLYGVLDSDTRQFSYARAGRRGLHARGWPRSPAEHVRRPGH